MKLALGAVALVVVLRPTLALAAPSSQPPMNAFNSAYYVCDSGGQFAVSYDSGKPKSARLTTSNNSKTYDLKRRPVQSGAEFAGAGVTFWTDGKDVRVSGTAIPLANCKRRP